MVKTLFFRMVFRKFSEITKSKPILCQHNIFLLLQWNLYKAETIGAKKCVRFPEMSTL